MLATQHNERLHNKELEMFTILRLTKVFCNKSENPSQNKRVIIVLDFDVIAPGAEVGYKIGNPAAMASDGSAPKTDNQNTSSNAGAANNQNINLNAGAALKRPAGPVGGQPPNKTTPASYQPQQRSVLSSRPGVANTGILTTPIASITPYQNKWTIKAR